MKKTTTRHLSYAESLLSMGGLTVVGVLTLVACARLAPAPMAAKRSEPPAAVKPLAPRAVDTDAVQDVSAAPGGRSTRPGETARGA